ncbi:MAG: hypothetical protein ACRDTH_07980 [Pseudonocardiaceae bacterium]
MSMMVRLAAMTSMLVLAVGCAGGGQPAAPEPVKPQAESTVAPAEITGPQPGQTREKTISARISNGKVEGVPARVEVDRGTPVRIEVTSDRSDELHIHGYDKTVPLALGHPAVAQFVADLPGVFEVETHGSGLLLFQLVVRG